jgi:hypothetical protein
VILIDKTLKSDVVDVSRQGGGMIILVKFIDSNLVVNVISVMSLSRLQ